MLIDIILKTNFKVILRAFGLFCVLLLLLKGIKVSKEVKAKLVTCIFVRQVRLIVEQGLGEHQS